MIEYVNSKNDKMDLMIILKLKAHLEQSLSTSSNWIDMRIKYRNIEKLLVKYNVENNKIAANPE